MIGALPWRRYVPLVVVVFLGTLISVFLFAIVRNAERERLQIEFERRSGNRAAALQKAIDHEMEILYSISGLYAASREVTRRQFREFVKGILPRGEKAIQALEWVPRVLDSDRSAYEEAARRDGLVDFQITEGRAKGQIARAERRSEYFPIYYVEPLEGNETLLGFDMASNDASRAALGWVRDAGEAVATERFRLAQEVGRPYGFLIFNPIYRIGAPHDTVEARRENLVGYVLGVYRIGDMVKESLRNLDAGGIDIYLYEEWSGARESFLYGDRSRSWKVVNLAEEDEAKVRSGMHWQTEVDVPGRRWSLLFYPTKEFLASQRTWQARGVLAGGLVLTVMLGTYLLVVLGRTIKIEQVVAERTAELKRLATTDTLTRLYNRAYFTSKLEEEFHRAERYHGPLSLMLLDIDHFKTVNDTLGHQAGDAYLEAIAGLVARSVRQVDTVARYGGEEFAIILPNTDLAETMVLAERLREQVEAFDVSFGPHTIRRTVSIGVASYNAGEAKTTETFLKEADHALYAVKKGGRNGVVPYREGMTISST